MKILFYLLAVNILALAVYFKISDMKQNKTGGKKLINIIKAEQIKIKDLPEVVDRLKNKQTEFDFIGITSNGIDCVYIMTDSNGLFYIDYEAMLKDQLPFIERIKDFAVANNYQTVMTNYGNKPKDYRSSEYAPVITIQKTMSADEIVALVEKIQKEVFGNNAQTTYEVVP